MFGRMCHAIMDGGAFASPVASSALGSPIKTFTAVFKLDKTDPHLMPDLSAAVVLDASTGGRQ